MAKGFWSSKNGLLWRGWIWVAVCLLWLSILIRRILTLRAAGTAVRMSQYVEAGVWGVILLFWLWNVSRALKAGAGSTDRIGR